MTCGVACVGVGGEGNEEWRNEECVGEVSEQQRGVFASEACHRGSLTQASTAALLAPGLTGML